MAKKTKLETRPVEELSPDQTAERFGFESFTRAPNRTIVGRRQLPLGSSEIWVVDPGAKKARRLPIKSIDFFRADISQDGTHAILYMLGGSIGFAGVIEVSLDNGKHTRLWEGGAAFNVRSESIQGTIYAGPDHVLLTTPVKQALTRRRAGKIEAVAYIESAKGCYRAESVLGGKFALLDGSSSSYLIAAKGDALFVVKKAAKKAETLSARDGKLFLREMSTRALAEVTNLEAIWNSL